LDMTGTIGVASARNARACTTWGGNLLATDTDECSWQKIAQTGGVGVGCVRGGVMMRRKQERCQTYRNGAKQRSIARAEALLSPKNDQLVDPV
jgi:hypothetical protein